MPFTNAATIKQAMAATKIGPALSIFCIHLLLHCTLVKGQANDDVTALRDVTVDNNVTITIGILLWSDPQALGKEEPYIENTISAVSLALDELKTRPTLANVTFRIKWRDSECDAKTSMAAGVELVMEDNADVILGTNCDMVCESVVHYLSYVNLPLIPLACSDPEMGDKVAHDVMVRVNTPSLSAPPGFGSIFRLYGWEKVVIFTDHVDDRCRMTAEALHESLHEYNVTIVEWIKIYTLSDKDIDKHLKVMNTESMIRIICLSDEDRNRFFLRAMHLGMAGSDYVYFVYQLLPGKHIREPWLPGNWTAEETKTLKQAYYSVKMSPPLDGYGKKPDEYWWKMQGHAVELRGISGLVRKVTVANLSGPAIDKFLMEVRRHLELPPWNFNIDYARPDQMPPLEAVFLHDATLLYGLLVEEMLIKGDKVRDGLRMLQMSRDRAFIGKSGEVALHHDADNVPNLWLWSYGPQDSQMHPCVVIRVQKHFDEQFSFECDIYWGNREAPPPDTPSCGFYDENCPDYSSIKALGGAIGGLTAVVIPVMLLMFYKRKKDYEQSLQKELWKISKEELEIMKNMTQSRSRTSMRSAASSSKHEAEVVNLATYKGTRVVLKWIEKQTISLNRTDLIELKAMKEMNHENMNVFFGVMVDLPKICIVAGYCTKGRLQDILLNEDIKLDGAFKLSLVRDIIQGIDFIHKSVLVSHGRLSSECCVVDGRWTLKITGYGLNAFIRGSTEADPDETYKQYRKMLWTAPELLRTTDLLRNGTHAGDIYSLGIICQEIMTRQMPFAIDFNEMDPKDVIDRVKSGGSPYFRPEIDLNLVEGTLQPLIAITNSCWSEDPDERPTIEKVIKFYKTLVRGKEVNLMDNMVEKLEKYASNLEDLVSARTEALAAEKAKADMLLYRMLPESVAEKLKLGQTVEAEIYEHVTIYFSDIVGFTALSSASSPMQVVDLLNDLYTLFDDIIDRHGVYKVETIGDAYMVASGLPKRNAEQHAAEIANMALDLLSAVHTNFRVRHRPELRMELRIGLHTGSCAAGVVGLTMPRYCLFGDTVNTASRMESNGLPLRIHCSQTTYDALQVFDLYFLKERGEIEMKGKGKQMTYWLYSKKNFEKPLPAIEL